MDVILIIIIFLFSVVIHEVSHGTVANLLGDPTAKFAGRLTLNPLKHLDPFGSIILPGFLILLNAISGGGVIFGWAKPVPVNPYNLKDQKWGLAKVAIAGPGANFLVALVFGLLVRFLLTLQLGGFFQAFSLILSYVVWVNLLLGLFNLFPIPPFDGSRILFALLPYSMENFKFFLERYGLVIILLFIFFGLGFLRMITMFFFQLIVGQPIFI